MQGEAIARAGREAAEELHVVLALLLEMIEGILGVGIAIEVEIHLRVVGLELGTGLRHETIEAHAVAVAFGVRQVGQHFGDEKRPGAGFHRASSSVSSVIRLRRIPGVASSRSRQGSPFSVMSSSYDVLAEIG